MKEEKIIAVHDDDINELLSSLGVYDKFIGGSAKCKFCSTIITNDNFQAILPFNDEVAFCCSNPICYMKMLRGE